MIVSATELARLVTDRPELKYGCVCDTNVLIASAYTTDSKNTWAEELVDVLHTHGVPLYTNMNVRSEFIHLSRRIMLPEGLMDFRSDMKGQLPDELELKLNSIRTSMDKPDRKEPYRLQEDDIKKLRQLFHKVYGQDGARNWNLFCTNYFLPYIQPAWDDVVELTRIQFLGSKEIEEGTHFKSRPSWSDAIDIVGRTGIGSADAMIINFFTHSHFPILASADTDVAFAMKSLELLSENQLIVVPT